jgi:hypothetical protein
LLLGLIAFEIAGMDAGVTQRGSRHCIEIRGRRGRVSAARSRAREKCISQAGSSGFAHEAALRYDVPQQEFNAKPGHVENQPRQFF